MFFREMGLHSAGNKLHQSFLLIQFPHSQADEAVFQSALSSSSFSLIPFKERKKENYKNLSGIHISGHQVIQDNHNIIQTSMTRQKLVQQNLNFSESIVVCDRCEKHELFRYFFSFGISYKL